MEAVKKVAILLTTEPEYGGEHQYLTMLVKSLKKCDGRFFSVIALCYNGYWVGWCKENQVEYFRATLDKYTQQHMEYSIIAPRIMGIYFSMTTELGKLVMKERIDLLICGEQGMFVPRCFCKKIQLVHDLMHRYEPNFPEIQDSYEYRERLFASVARNADVILVDSDLGKKQFIESYGRIASRKLKIIKLPFTVPEHIGRVKEEYVDVPDRYVFYPAQFWEHKNHIQLLYAVKLLKEKCPNIHLVLVGSEKNSLEKVRRIIKESNLEKQVSILGFVSNGQITYLYRHAVALVMPSYFGPTNIPPLEAMALGCPVIVSNKYAMGEQVGEAGLLFHPDEPKQLAECILKVWNDENFRQHMIAEGLKQSRKWLPVDFQRRFIGIVLRELSIKA